MSINPEDIKPGDGNPPTPEPVWLDAAALEESYYGTIVQHEGASSPRWLGPDFLWYRIGTSVHGVSSADIAPARLLWTPEAAR